MFKQFKRKQLITNVSILTILLVVIFTSLYISTYRDIMIRQDNELERLLDNININAPNDPTGRNPGFDISFGILFENGEVIDYYNGPGVPQELLDDIANEIDKPYGTIELDGFTYKYISKIDGLKTLYALKDITRDQYLLSSIITIYTIIFLISVLLVSIVSYFMTNKSVKPIQDSYLKQKEFIANASHELKTPLTVINANIDVLLDTDDFRDNRWLNYIKNESDRMNKLTNDLLYLAKTSDIDNSIKENFNASSITKGLLLSVDALTYEKEISLEEDIQEDVIINFDKSQYCQLVMILLDNAIKYTPSKESIIVTLSITGNSFMLKVKNTGISLNSEEISKVFDRFYMADKSRGVLQNSHGLGLSIAYEIAKNNNAFLEIKSKENNFTEFLLKMKVKL